MISMHSTCHWNKELGASAQAQGAFFLLNVHYYYYYYYTEVGSGHGR